VASLQSDGRLAWALLGSSIARAAQAAEITDSLRPDQPNMRDFNDEDIRNAGESCVR